MYKSHINGVFKVVSEYNQMSFTILSKNYFLMLN